MASPDPHTLSPSTRSTALFVARAIFYNGLLLTVLFAVAATAVLVFKVGDLPGPNDRLITGGVFAFLAVLSLAIGWAGKLRIDRLKR
jgi:hypothetical protein